MPRSDLTVYGRADSSNVQAVMWGAAELGLAPTRLDFGHRFGGLDTPDYLAMNPHGRVPTLRDGDITVWESCAILRYLASAYGDGGAFWPADPAARSQVDMWAEWAKLDLCLGFTVPIFWARVRTAAQDRDETALARALAAFDAQLAKVEARVAAQGYLAGEAFTLADVVAGHILYRYYDIDIPRPDRPGVAAYYGRLTERPAYRTHVMLSYDALKDPQA